MYNINYFDHFLLCEGSHVTKDCDMINSYHSSTCRSFLRSFLSSFSVHFHESIVKADVGIMLWGGDSDEMVRLGLGSGVRVADTLIGLESVKSGVGDGAKRVTAGRSGGLAVGVTTTF